LTTELFATDTLACAAAPSSPETTGRRCLRLLAQELTDKDVAKLERHQQVFTELGPLRAAVMHHASGLLAILPCTSEPELLVVAHGAQKNVDWRAWQEQVRQVGQLIRDNA
jgi:hypothetical protein